MFNRLSRVVQQALDPDQIGKVRGRQPTLENLLPGDVISFWDSTDSVVQAVLACTEVLNGRPTHWRWNLLDGSKLLETGPEGHVLYPRSQILHQGSVPFEVLTTAPEQGGVLKAFEARVRAGNAARNPALFELDGNTYQVVSTGTFGAQLVGVPNPSAHVYPQAAVWQDIDPNDPGQNVYFELEPTEEGDGEVTTVLGIWTTHIALFFGKLMSNADVQTIFPRSEEGGSHA